MSGSLSILGLRSARTLTLALVVGATSGSVLAHDLWIEPTNYSPELGKTLGLRLRVGVDFMGDPLPRDPALIERFVFFDQDAEKPVVGRDGADPAGLIRPTVPGLIVVGYYSKPSPVVLTAQKFNEYLSEEGLESIAALRAKRGETNAEAREQFARCAKCLILAGPASATQSDRVMGFPLELVAGSNPYLLEPGQTLPVRLIYQDKPLSGVLVMALNQRDPTAKVGARTDKAGRVQLRLAQPGPWLIKAVHMMPAPAGSDHQWFSLWASLTFELTDGAGRAKSASRE